MGDKNAKGSMQSAGPKSLFRQISKGDLVTIRDKAGERKGHATRREYGNWVLVLERNMGTALANEQNVVAASKPKKLAQAPKVGQRLIYDDGRVSVGKVLEVGPRSMYVLFENRMEPSLIYFDGPEWMDYISFEVEDDQSPSAPESETETRHQE